MCDQHVRGFGNPAEQAHPGAISPIARWTKLHVHGDAGRLMDFASGETAHGHVVSAETLVRPTDRIEIDALVSRLRMRSRDEARVDVRQEAEALTLVYHRSVADSLRLQWTHDRFRRAGPLAGRDDAQSLALVYAHRPDWRRSLFLGVNLGRRAANDARVPDIDTQRVFMKWSLAFGS